MTQHTEQLQAFLNKFHAVKRHHYLPGTDEHESDSTHSLTVAMLAWYFYETLGLSSQLDLAKIMTYALTHDMAETYAGDVCTYASADARAQKERDEQKALAQIGEEFDDFFPALATTIGGYEARTDQESLFVWSVDKIQAYTQGVLDHWRPYHEYGVTQEMFDKTLQMHRQKLHPALVPFFEAMMTTYRDSYRQSLLS